MFITIEDETGVANLVIWPSLFERQRRIVLSAGMMAAHGKIQREGEVVHLVARYLTDLSEDLASVGERDSEFPLPHGRGDQSGRAEASRRIGETCRRKDYERAISTFPICTSTPLR